MKLEEFTSILEQIQIQNTLDVYRNNNHITIITLLIFIFSCFMVA